MLGAIIGVVIIAGMLVAVAAVIADHMPEGVLLRLGNKFGFWNEQDAEETRPSNLPPKGKTKYTPYPKHAA